MKRATIFVQEDKNGGGLSLFYAKTVTNQINKNVGQFLMKKLQKMINKEKQFIFLR